MCVLVYTIKWIHFGMRLRKILHRSYFIQKCIWKLWYLSFTTQQKKLLHQYFIDAEMKVPKVSPEQRYEKYENSIKLVFLSRKKENYLYVFLFSRVWKQMFHYHYTKLTNIIIIQIDMKTIFNLYLSIHLETETQYKYVNIF